MSKIYQKVRGTEDYFGRNVYLFRKIDRVAREVFLSFNYKELILPILEEADIFKKGVGDTTDVVDKQLFYIERKDKDIVLRPEGTAQVVRFFLEHDLDKKGNFWKFFYTGPMFRGERPQRGRLRQFYHIGVEAIGSDSIFLDAEMIIMVKSILDRLEIGSYTIKVNSLGCLEDKKKLSEMVESKLKDKVENLCGVCQERLKFVPLRVLDCKEEGCQNIISNLNLDVQWLCADCLQKFNSFRSLLDDLGVEYEYSPYLVRGLDYYTNTVFEIVSSNLGTQSSIGGGGRYNNLIEVLGGRKIPAIGFALGVDRIMLIMKDKEIISPFILVGYVSSYTQKEAFKIVGLLRKEGIICDFDYMDHNIKGQLRYAQKNNCRFVIIVGDEEYKKGKLILKDMLLSTQEEIEKDNVIHVLKERIGHVKNT